MVSLLASQGTLSQDFLTTNFSRISISSQFSVLNVVIVTKNILQNEVFILKKFFLNAVQGQVKASWAVPAFDPTLRAGDWAVPVMAGGQGGQGGRRPTAPAAGAAGAL